MDPRHPFNRLPSQLDRLYDEAHTIALEIEAAIADGRTSTVYRGPIHATNQQLLVSKGYAVSPVLISSTHHTRPEHSQTYIIQWSKV